MAIKSSTEYRERLKSMRQNVYIGGRVIGRDDPIIAPGVNVISYTFDAAQDNRFKELATATSHISGEPISRFTHVHRSVDDLFKKLEMTRTLCQQTGGCIQRCMASDALNAIGVASKEIDDANGTEYHQRFLNFLRQFQHEDLVGNAAQTDVKGDRSKRPHEQSDPDLYLRVVEKRRDGIVVRGAKAHNSVAPYADVLLVVPTRAMTKEEADWAVSFVVPADTPGLKLVCRATSPRQRVKYQAPYPSFGAVDSFTIFDDVFVPWERVFMCGEWQFAGRLALLFANFHRHSYCGCKPAITDIVMGATSLVSDYNGVGNVPNLRDEVTELVALAELVYGAGIAASTKGKATSSGIYEPESIYSNVGRYLAGKNIYHEYETLINVAGGLPATLPPEEDFLNPETGPLLEKYIMRRDGVSAENQHRLFRFISDFAVSSYGGVFQAAGVHGGGSPSMEKVLLRSQYDLKTRRNLARYLAGIEERE